MQENISQQPHHICSHIPEPLLYLLLWGTLHRDGGTGRWTGGTAKAASQLRSENMVLRRKLRASLDSKTPLIIRIKTKESKKWTCPPYHCLESSAEVVITWGSPTLSVKWLDQKSLVTPQNARQALYYVLYHYILLTLPDLCASYLFSALLDSVD